MKSGNLTSSAALTAVNLHSTLSSKELDPLKNPGIDVLNNARIKIRDIKIKFPSYITEKFYNESRSREIGSELVQQIDCTRQTKPLGPFKVFCQALDSMFTWQNHLSALSSNPDQGSQFQKVLGVIKTRLNKMQERIQEIIYETASQYGDKFTAAKRTQGIKDLGKIIEGEIGVQRLETGQTNSGQTGWRELLSTAFAAAA